MNDVQRHFRTSCYVLLLALAGASPVRAAAPEAAVKPALGTTRDLPSDGIAARVSPEQWKILHDLPYAGFVVLEGVIARDGTVDVRRVGQSTLSGAFEAKARELSHEVRLKAASVGTTLSPEAKVYVIFYPNIGGENLAVVYARQVNEGRRLSSQAVDGLKICTYK